MCDAYLYSMCMRIVPGVFLPVLKFSRMSFAYGLRLHTPICRHRRKKRTYKQHTEHFINYLVLFACRYSLSFGFTKKFITHMPKIILFFESSVRNTPIFYKTKNLKKHKNKKRPRTHTAAYINFFVNL